MREFVHELVKEIVDLSLLSGIEVRRAENDAMFYRVPIRQSKCGAERVKRAGTHIRLRILLSFGELKVGGDRACVVYLVGWGSRPVSFLVEEVCIQKLECVCMFCRIGRECVHTVLSFPGPVLCPGDSIVDRFSLL